MVGAQWNHILHDIYRALAQCQTLLASFTLLSRTRLFCDPVDYSPPGSFVHGILKARIMEWVAISFPGYLPNRRVEPPSPALAGGFFTTEPTREALYCYFSFTNNSFG